MVGAAMVVVALNVGLLGPRSTGRALEEVNPVTHQELLIPSRVTANGHSR